MGSNLCDFGFKFYFKLGFDLKFMVEIKLKFQPKLRVNHKLRPKQTTWLYSVCVGNYPSI